MMAPRRPRWPTLLRRRARAARRGLSLIELVLATGLCSLLMIAVFALIETSMTTLRASEERRSLLELGGGVLDLLEHDLRHLEGGAAGDLLVEWVRIDTDGDGTAEKPVPLLRFVRQASAAEVARHLAGLEAERAAREPASAETPSRARTSAPAETPPPPARIGGPALFEVCWALLPEGRGPEERSAGRLWRGERLSGPADGPSIFEPAFLRPDGLPGEESLVEVSGGVLFAQVLLATQTSLLEGGWRIGPDLADVATSWDAWGRGRPDDTRHPYNEAAAGMPRPGALPALPRRVRIEVEVERPVDRLRRPRLAQDLPATGAVLVVDDVDRLPIAAEGLGPRYVLVGAEWMRIRSVSGQGATVERGRRGTMPAYHSAGALVHHGLRLVREVPVPLFREDWNL